MSVFCGIDWAEDHHDVALVDQTGTLLASQCITDDVDGYQQLLGLLAEQGDTSDHPIPIAIETPRGLLVACLRAAGRPIYPINPLAVARYCERHSVARVKSGPRLEQPGDKTRIETIQKPASVRVTDEDLIGGRALPLRRNRLESRQTAVMSPAAAGHPCWPPSKPRLPISIANWPSWRRLRVLSAHSCGS
jgi:hypothetical protein